MSTTQEKAAVIRKALDDARAHRATLPELAQAHELATGLNLPGCAEELRQHIADKSAPPKGRAAPSLGLMGDVVAGIISGYFVHHIVS
jgi:hypothetical protein